MCILDVDIKIGKALRVIEIKKKFIIRSIEIYFTYKYV